MRFKEIHGYSGYLIYSDGRVWSPLKNKFLKCSPGVRGYPVVMLKDKTFKVHRLVATHFIPNPKRYDQVNHKNGVKTDNRLKNLEWCSASMNSVHAFSIGLRKRPKNRAHPMCKFSDYFIRKIQTDFLKNKDKYGIKAELSRKYKVSPSHVSNIINGQRRTP